MTDGVRPERHAVWPAVAVAAALLLGTYVLGFEVFAGETFRLAFAVASVSGAVLALTALRPGALRGLWGHRLPVWASACPAPIAAAGVYRYLDGGPSVARFAVGAAVFGAAMYVASVLLGVVGSERPSLGVPLELQVPLVATAGLAAYLAAAGSLSFLTVGFLVATSLFSFYVWGVVPLALVERKSTDEGGLELPDPAPDVAVLIPAYDEANTIERSVESVLAADYPRDSLDLFVIDDGSTDGTYERVTRYADERLTVLRKENGGKYSALNYGLLCSESDYVACIDADSVVEPDAIRRVVAKLHANPGAGAVAGTVKVGNRDRALTKLQALEYVVAINTFRRAFSHFGVVSIVPGCLGVFRRSAVEDVGGYDPDTVTEDFDLTVKLLRAGWSVRLADAVVWTEAPFTVRDLYAQRKRWAQGAIRTLYKHVDILTTHDAGSFRRFSYPFYAVSTLSVPFVLPAVAVSIAASALDDVLVLFAFWTALIGLVAALSVALEREDVRLLAYVPAFVVGYQPLLNAFVSRGFVAVVFGHEGGWGTIQRASGEDAERFAAPREAADE